jgi:hypothetical protein
MKIAIDCDNVLFKNDVVHDVIKENKINIKEWSWSLKELGLVAQKECFDRFDMINYMCFLKPFRGNLSTVKFWHTEGHKMYCVTSRALGLSLKTKEMIHRYYPEIIDVFVCDSYDKSEIYLREKFDVVIDDNPENIKQALKVRKTKGFLISNSKTPYNWNSMDYFKKYKRVYVAKGLKDISL